MIKTVKQIRVNKILLASMLLFISSANAQPVLFSSDQWPKRWGRVMNHQMPNTWSSSEKRMHKGMSKVSHQGWGQQKIEKRNKRSRTPNYNDGNYNRYENDALKRRYAVPEAYRNNRPYYLMNDRYSQGNYYENYYGNNQQMPRMNYSGGYSGGYPGMGFPAMGFPFSSQFLLAPGLTPGMGYPW